MEKSGVFIKFVKVMLVGWYLTKFCMDMAAAAAPIISTDQAALLAFRDHISDDPSHILASNWSATTSACNWLGVTCAQGHHRVMSLNLSRMGLTGTIPPHLGNLSFLAQLILQGNNIYGFLPDELAGLRQLKLLNFKSNNFSGEIPAWFGLMPKLESLFLSQNSFTGLIPPALCNSSSLLLLDLSSNQLSGSLPSNIWNIPLMQVIDLSDNMLSGPIPSTISNLSSLHIIDVGNNSLSGTLPENIFHHLPQLNGLFASWNHLSGLLPSSLFSCHQLLYLSLSQNEFLGTIPKEIGNLTMLSEVFLGHNMFTGTLPNEMGALLNLQTLATQSAILGGLLPPEIFNITTLRSILLANNKFSGSLPANIGITLPNLEKLVIGMNKFHGSIPNSIANASELFYLDLADNSFSGFIPNELGRLRSLEWLNLFDNSLTLESSFSDLISSLANCKYLRHLAFSSNPLYGIIPASTGNLSAFLEFISLQNCRMRGLIPMEIGNLSGLRILDFSNNNLTGPIPSTIGRLKKLQGVDLSANRLYSLPDEICHLQNLVYLYLDNNEVKGPLTTCIGNLTSLRELSLASNRLSFTLPSTLWSLTYLLRLNVSSNSLNGSLASDIGKMSVLIELDVSDNKLTGSIPSSIGSMLDLVNASFMHNAFEGPIPESFGKLVSLEFMDLSQNNLVGEIPKSLEALSHLRYLNLSFNRLEGEVPTKGPFANFSAQSFSGNLALCGPPQMQVPPCKAGQIQQSKSFTRQIVKYVIPAIASVLLLLALVLVLTRICKRKANIQNQADVSELATWRRISYQELSAATNRFSQSNLLGVGSFGSVFRGTLSDGLAIAVKVFNSQVDHAFQSFDTECELMCGIRHRNLVKVISSCSNIDFKALVLEYMPQGSLENILYCSDHFLGLLQRLNIMIDVAAALEYLHHSYSQTVIHCDLKPSNVLLDDDMTARVADFGIAKLLSGVDSATQTMTLATFGYMAPEYGMEGTVSRKVDVYSYGILVMETFMKKKPTDELFEGEMNLRKWVRDSFPDKVSEIVDVDLLIDQRLDSAANKECLLSIVGLALDCAAETAEERLSIKDVHSKLQKVKFKYLRDIGVA